MSFTNELLQSYYGKKELFPIALAMTLMRRLDSKIEIVKIISDYVNDKKKYWYDDLRPVSSLIINIGNIIISEDYNDDVCESVTNFDDSKLEIIIGVIVELLNYLKVNGIIYKTHSSNTIVARNNCKIRYIIISYHCGRLTRSSRPSVNSTRAKVITFNVKSLVRIPH